MSQSSTLPAPDHRLLGASGAPTTRRSLWIPWSFVAFMLMVVFVNGLMIYYAERTFSGLDTQQYYQEGVSYNAVLKDAAASAALGWSDRVEVLPTAGGSADQRTLRVTMTDKSGTPLGGLKMIVHLVRPVSAGLDQTLVLKPTVGQPGVYATRVTLPVLGSWDVRIVAQGGKAPWQASQRIVVE